MQVLFNQSTIPSAVLQPALPGIQDGHPRGELKAAFRGEEPFRCKAINPESGKFYY